jgi:hypothetical protein
MKIHLITNFFQIQNIVKMYNKVVIHCNVFNSYEALSIIKQTISNWSCVIPSLFLRVSTTQPNFQRFVDS